MNQMQTYERREIEFEVVKDFVPPPQKGRTAAHVDAVLSGETIFIPHTTQSTVHSRYRRVRAAGFKVHSHAGERNGVPGIYVWATPDKNKDQS